jgi:hypothetical protein
MMRIRVPGIAVEKLRFEACPAHIDIFSCDQQFSARLTRNSSKAKRAVKAFSVVYLRYSRY